MGRRSTTVIVALSVALLTGCGDFSDPPPDPSVAPLEVVANDASRAACALNRAEVAAGVHEVVVITEGADAVVELRDASGHVLLHQQGDTFPQAPAGDEEEGAAVSTARPTELRLEAGSYSVTCRYPNGVEGTAPLHVGS